MGPALETVFQMRSWKLCRLSSATYVSDINPKTIIGSPDKTTLGRMMREGNAYTCTIGVGKRCFGATPEAAAERAIAEDLGAGGRAPFRKRTDSELDKLAQNIRGK